MDYSRGTASVLDTKASKKQQRRRRGSDVHQEIRESDPSAQSFGGEKTGLADLTQALFHTGNFSMEQILAAKGQNGIAALRSELAQLDHRAVEELKRLMHENYHDVMSASQAVLKLENEMQSLRKTITSSSLMVQQLKDLADSSIRVSGSSQDRLLRCRSHHHTLWEDTGDGVAWYDLLDELDMAIAERRVPHALELIKQAEQAAEELGSRVQPETAHHGSPSPTIDELTAARLQRSDSLIPVLQAMMADPTASNSEIKQLTQALVQVAGKVQGLQGLLEAHNGAIKRQQQNIVKPQHAGGADADGVEYAAALAQRTFMGIANALDDVDELFSAAVPQLTALVLTWAIDQATQACKLLKSNALDQFSCPAGLPSTVSVLTLMMSYATALEVSHNMRLTSCVWKELWGHLEQVLTRHFRHMSDDVKAAVEQDIDAMAKPDFPADDNISNWDALTRLFPHLQSFSSEMRQLCSTLLPVAGPQLGSFMRKALSELFMVYTRAMRNGMSAHVSADGMIPEHMGPAVELLMEGVTLLVERVLPSILGPMSSAVGDVIDVNHLMGLIDNTAAAFGLVEAT